MNSNRTIAVIVGVLFLISNATFMVGAAGLIEPILSAPDYLALASANRTQIILGVLLELINGVAYVGIGVLMFPILRQRFASMALGYVGFRVLEFVMQSLADISPLSLLAVSEASIADPTSFQAIGTLLLAQRYWAFQMVSITFGLGALLFYTMLYRAHLVPRWLSVWGLIGAIAVLGSTVAGMFGLDASSVGILMLLNELVLAVWLVAKGFNPAAAIAKPAQTVLNPA